MITTIKEERLRWVLPIVNKNLKLKDVALLCPHGKRSLERWVAAYQHGGEEALVPRSTRPRTNPHETTIDLKERVIGIRKETGLCAKKIMWKLDKQGITIHERTVGKILKAEGLVRIYRIKKMKMKYVKIPLLPGEIMEIDVKYVPKSIEQKAYFQYTAIDCASRWRYLSVYDAQSTLHSIRFLREVICHFPHRIRAVKTDNGAIFTNYYIGMTKRSDLSVKRIHAFDTFCADNRIIHYLIDPGKPAQNGKVERSHREDQEKFYEKNIFLSYDELKHKLSEWNIYYNNLEHCSLNGQTPNEYLTHYASLNPPNVCT